MALFPSEHTHIPRAPAEFFRILESCLATLDCVYYLPRIIPSPPLESELPTSDHLRGKTGILCLHMCITQMCSTVQYSTMPCSTGQDRGQPPRLPGVSWAMLPKSQRVCGWRLAPRIITSTPSNKKILTPIETLELSYLHGVRSPHECLAVPVLQHSCSMGCKMVTTL